MTYLNATGIRKLLTCIFVLTAVGLVSARARAGTDCAIGLKESTTVPTVNGAEAAGEWSDAATSTLDSSSSCFERLLDYVSGPPDSYPDRVVTVKSKRYQSGGAWYLGFLFEVHDATAAGPCASGQICVGEKIVLQFNRTINGDSAIVPAEDKRITLTHKWAGTGSDVTGETMVVENASADATCTPAFQWAPATATGISFEVRKDVTGGGYRAEIQVPVQFIKGAPGDLSADIGVAFAVINDFGKSTSTPPDFDCSAAGTCEGAGASFPSTMPATNTENPVEAECDLGWTVPKQWGVGYLQSPPGQVTISRMPAYWNSNAIHLFECDSKTESYTYYPNVPCKIRIVADFVNTGATARRKVAFLWAKHGTGDPTEYNFVQLRDEVIAAGTPASPMTSPVTALTTPPQNTANANHPCLRVYAFPETLSSGEEASLRTAVVLRGALMTVVSAHSVPDAHWAQKNISRHSSVTDCPDTICKMGWLDRSWFDFDFIKSASAQPAAPIDGGVVSPPVKDIRLSGNDWERYAKDHVIVQVRTVAKRAIAAGKKPLYNFVEDFGGVIQLFPLEMVRAKPELPVEFQVSNGSKDTVHVKVLTELHVPEGLSGVTLKLGEQTLTLQPGSVTTVKGKLENGRAEPPDAGTAGSGGTVPDQPTNGGGKMMWIALVVIVLIVLFVLWRRRNPTP